MSVRRRRASSCPGPIALEPLEARLLLSVTGMASSKAMSIVWMMTAWKDSGVIDGTIAKGAYTSEYSDGTTLSRGEAYTDGVDPGWYSPGVNGKLRADAHTISSLTGPGVPGQAGAASLVDYIVSIKQIKPLPAAFVNMIFNVPVISHFSTQATIVGNPTVDVESGDAQAYVEVCLSGGAEYAKGETKLDWDKDKGRADGDGEVTQIDPHTFANTITYWASTQNSDYLSILLNASGSSMVAPTHAEAGSVDTYAYSYVTGIEFDQATFNAAQGAKAFPLDEYFELVHGVDLAKGPRVNDTRATCAQPDIELASLTGPDSSATGDQTPTFTGGVTLKNKTLKTGVAILYVDGVEAGRGTVSNGVYRVTPLADLSPGSHSITVSAGATADLMGSQSDPLTISIDTSLPRGDNAALTLGGDGAKSIIFTDGDGTKATLKLTAGSASLTFAGDGLNQVESNGKVTLTGLNLHLTNLDVTGDSSLGSLSISCGKAAKLADKFIDVGEISFTSGVKSISAGGVDLLGDLVVGGAVGSLALNSVRGGAPLAVHTISATSIGTFKVAAELNLANISLSQGVVTGQDKLMALGTLTVGGVMSSSTIDSQGHIGKVTVGKLTESSIFAGVDLTRSSLGVLPDEGADFKAAARLDSLTVKGVKDGLPSFQSSFVAASSLGTITVLDLPTDGSAAGGVAGEQLLGKYIRKSGKTTPMTVKGPLAVAHDFDILDGYVARLV